MAPNPIITQKVFPKVTPKKVVRKSIKTGANPPIGSVNPQQRYY